MGYVPRWFRWWLAYEQHRSDEDDAEEITAYASRLYKVQNKGKALHDYVEWDSEVEKSFAEALAAREEVKLFFKLPRWFQIPPPVGLQSRLGDCGG